MYDTGGGLFNFRSYDAGRLDDLAESFAAAKPFPHLVIDDFLTADAGRVVPAFPGPEWAGWRAFADGYQHNKRTCCDIDALPQLFQRMVHDLNSPAFLGFLERVTGIRGLIPDPFLEGGGLHASGPGGVLTPHVDFHHYARLELFRRINVLVYFNPDWAAEDGGSLELYEKGTSTPACEITPVYGRMVLFQTDDRSVHGFSREVSAGAPWRKSLALYYYTSEETGHFSGDSDTHWQMHGRQSGAGVFQITAYKALLRLSRLFSQAAHSVNPNLRRGARAIRRAE